MSARRTTDHILDRVTVRAQLTCLESGNGKRDYGLACGRGLNFEVPMINVSDRDEVRQFEDEERLSSSESLQRAGVPVATPKPVRRRGGGFPSGEIRNMRVAQNALFRLASSLTHSKD